MDPYNSNRSLIVDGIAEYKICKNVNNKMPPELIRYIWTYIPNRVTTPIHKKWLLEQLPEIEKMVDRIPEKKMGKFVQFGSPAKYSQLYKSFHDVYNSIYTNCVELKESHKTTNWFGYITFHFLGELLETNPERHVLAVRNMIHGIKLITPPVPVQVQTSQYSWEAAIAEIRSKYPLYEGH
jgi:hypothetical protein